MGSRLHSYKCSFRVTSRGKCLSGALLTLPAGHRRAEEDAPLTSPALADMHLLSVCFYKTKLFMLRANHLTLKYTPQVLFSWHGLLL